MSWLTLRGGSTAARWFGISLLLCSAGGCGRSVSLAPEMPAPVRAAAAPGRLPALGPGSEIEPGIRSCEVFLPRAGGVRRLWIYLPARPSGKKLPCVLIAPAGSHLFDGASLGDGSRPEHLPYARAGFAVVAYEVDGDLPEHASGREVLTAARAFREADAGLVNAREALSYALARIPGIDPHRLYTAGHSSAATLSLLVAENEPRVTACIAYAPVCDVPARLGERLLGALSRAIPGYEGFIERRSPQAGVARLRCPVFLFHADDDANVPTREVARFAAALRRTNPRVALVRVSTGNHYRSMIQQGIPRAIDWLRRLPS